MTELLHQDYMSSEESDSENHQFRVKQLPSLKNKYIKGFRDIDIVGESRLSANARRLRLPG